MPAKLKELVPAFEDSGWQVSLTDRMVEGRKECGRKFFTLRARIAAEGYEVFLEKGGPVSLRPLSLFLEKKEEIQEIMEARCPIEAFSLISMRQFKNARA